MKNNFDFLKYIANPFALFGLIASALIYFALQAGLTTPQFFGLITLVCIVCIIAGVVVEHYKSRKPGKAGKAGNKNVKIDASDAEMQSGEDIIIAGGNVTKGGKAGKDSGDE